MSGAFQSNAFQNNAFQVLLPFAFAQAQASITTTKPSGQAHARIQTQNTPSGQAQVFIVTLRIWYKLDETSGTLIDSADSMDLTTTGGMTYNQPGYRPESSSLTFSGGYGYRNSPPSSLPIGGSARTYLIWLKTTSTARRTALGHGATNTRQAFNASLNHDSANTIGYWVWADDTTGISAPNLTDGNWHQIVYTYVANSTQIKVYYDGALAGTGTLGGPLDTSNGTFFLGNSIAFGELFDGSLDEVKIYDFAFTATQVLNSYIQPGFGQALALISNPFGWFYAQAQADIKSTNAWASAQAQAFIRKSAGYGQAQTQIASVRFTQTLGEVLTNLTNPNTRFTQIFAEVLQLNLHVGLGQAQALISSSIKVNIGQANAYIANTFISSGFGQAQADTKKAQSNTGQAQAQIRGTYFRSAQAQVFILSVAYGQAQAIINQAMHVGQSQADVKIRVSASAQAQAKILIIGNGFGQAQASINQSSQTGQAQARITGLGLQSGQAQARLIAFDVPQTGQAQAYVSSSVVFAQANADIKATANAYGQALAFVGHFKWGQAQARIIAFDVPRVGQANVDIIKTYQTFGLALAAIDHGGHGQALADIHVVVSATGNGFAFILPPTFWGQAQAQINAFDVSRSGQANADIITTYRKFAQAQTQITKGTGFGQANVDIKNSFYGKRYGQALAFIGHFKWGQAQAYISKSKSSGQAQAMISTKSRGFAQALGTIARPEKSGQAQAEIIQTYFASGQAFALIDDRFFLAQAEVAIKQTYRQMAQVNADIKAKSSKAAQANAMIRVRHWTSAQAQAYMISKKSSVGQAQVYINHFKFGQALARLLAFNVPKCGQAQAYILASTVTPPGPTSNAQRYLVRFNDQTLPGYAQSESIDSQMNLITYAAPYKDLTLKEYLGLLNKTIVMTLRLWEATYLLCKERLRDAATILRSARDFSELYIQRSDSHYLALVKSIKAEKAVESGSKTLDYVVEFDAKPWLIENQEHTITGTGTVSTTGRTLNDGGWTPTIVTVSGTNVIITGTTATGADAGQIMITGTCTNLVIDTELFTATEGGVNKNDIMNKDYSLYVGPGVTNFQITGASSCTIQYHNRWPL